jgi:hypothetical protein
MLIMFLKLVLKVVIRTTRWMAALGREETFVRSGLRNFYVDYHQIGD